MPNLPDMTSTIMTTTLKVHVAGIPKAAVDVMYKLIAHSEHVTKSGYNRMSFEEFLLLTGLAQETSWSDIVDIMSQCGKAVASAKKYESAKPRQRLISFGSWPVFRRLSVGYGEVIFDVNPLMWDESKE